MLSESKSKSKIDHEGTGRTLIRFSVNVSE